MEGGEWEIGKEMDREGEQMEGGGNWITSFAVASSPWGGGATCVLRQLCLRDHSDVSVLRRTSLCVSRRSGPFGRHFSLPSDGVCFFPYLAAVLCLFCAYCKVPLLRLMTLSEKCNWQTGFDQVLGLRQCRTTRWGGGGGGLMGKGKKKKEPQ